MQINFSGGGTAQSGSITATVGAMVRVRLSAFSQCALIAKITSPSGDISSVTIDKGELFEVPVASGDSVYLAYDGQGHDKAICTGFLEAVYDVLPSANNLAAASVPVSGALAASGNSAAFTPDLSRAIWVHLWGAWTGTVQLKRSTDNSVTWYPITTGSGTVKGVWSGNVNAPITEETCAGAIYRLEATLTSGNLSYEVRQ